MIDPQSFFIGHRKKYSITAYIISILVRLMSINNEVYTKENKIVFSFDLAQRFS